MSRATCAWDPVSVQILQTCVVDRYGLVVLDWAIKQARSYKSKITRDSGAPPVDFDTVQGNFGLEHRGTARVIWDQYGPITDPINFKIAKNFLFNNAI